MIIIYKLILVVKDLITCLAANAMMAFSDWNLQKQGVGVQPCRNFLNYLVFQFELDLCIMCGCCTYYDQVIV